VHHQTLLGSDIQTGAGSLDRIGEVAARVAPGHAIALITDERVGALYGDRARRALAAATPPERIVYQSIPPGEQQKTRERWSELTDGLLDRRCGRDTLVVALGGGVVGDLAGFVAATYMRGVPFLQVPTTLLAMVDASIGGKTGVDTPAGKNLVGAFHQPAAVVADPGVLATLAEEHVRAGMAEVLKHGAIADARYFDTAANFAAGLQRARDSHVFWDSPEAEALISRSIEIKGDVVMRDERESGIREILNAGHTLGHALEVVSGYRIAHGEAVAVGLVAETLVGERLGVTAPGTAARLRESLGLAGLPTTLPEGVALETLLPAMQTDKKVRASRLRIPFIAEIGRMAGSGDSFARQVDPEQLRILLFELQDAGEI
jgi:3-dehydroquinate synthase